MTNETDEYASSREALRAIQSVFQQAVKDNDIEAMREHVDADFSFVSFTDRSFENFDDFVAQWKVSRESLVGGGSFTTELNPETSLFEGDIAICKGKALNQLVDKKGKAFSYHSHWTVIFKKTQGQWKVLRAHNSLDPFANPMLVSGVRNKLITVGVGALLIGGLVSVMLNMLLS